MVGPADQPLVAVMMAAAKFEETRIRCWQKYFGEDGYRHQLPMFHALALEMFRRSRPKRPIYKTEAGRMLLVQHSVTAIRHLNDMERRGWVQFVPDPTDRRRTEVLPTETFLGLTASYLVELAEKIRTFNVPLS